MYYIFENQIREDGQVNNYTTARQTLASGLSYYYERKSKMVMNEQFPQVAIMITDEKLRVIEHCVVDTLYKKEINE